MALHISTSEDEKCVDVKHVNVKKSAAAIAAVDNN